MLKKSTKYIVTRNARYMHGMLMQTMVGKGRFVVNAERKVEKPLEDSETGRRVYNTGSQWTLLKWVQKPVEYLNKID